jgi:hypothetical protein
MSNPYSRALDSGNFVAARLCHDCLYIVSYAAYPEGDTDWTTERANTVAANLAAYDVTIGHNHNGEYAERSCWHYPNRCEDDCDCAKTDFSWAPCDLCSSALGGSRGDAILIRHDDLGG